MSGYYDPLDNQRQNDACIGFDPLYAFEREIEEEEELKRKRRHEQWLANRKPTQRTEMEALIESFKKTLSGIDSIVAKSIPKTKQGIFWAVVEAKRAADKCKDVGDMKSSTELLKLVCQTGLDCFSSSDDCLNALDEVVSATKETISHCNILMRTQNEIFYNFIIKNRTTSNSENALQSVCNEVYSQHDVVLSEYKQSLNKGFWSKIFGK